MLPISKLPLEICLLICSFATPTKGDHTDPHVAFMNLCGIKDKSKSVLIKHQWTKYRLIIKYQKKYCKGFRDKLISSTCTIRTIYSTVMEYKKGIFFGGKWQVSTTKKVSAMSTQISRTRNFDNKIVQCEMISPDGGRGEEAFESQNLESCYTHDSYYLQRILRRYFPRLNYTRIIPIEQLLTMNVMPADHVWRGIISRYFQVIYR